MAKDLSTPSDALSTERFYTPLHVQMARDEGRRGIRPTIAEFEAALQKFRVPSGGIALDAGCGATASAIAAMVRHGFERIYAIDANPQSVEVTRLLVERKGFSNVDLRTGSILELPYENGFFDFVACIGVAHHTASPERGIEELARVLKPGGHLYISLYCFADSAAESAVRVLRRIGSKLEFERFHPFVRRSRLWNNFITDHMYVPTLWLFHAGEVRTMLAKYGLSIIAEWPSRLDGFQSFGKLGTWLTGDGLMRVWLCRKL